MAETPGPAISVCVATCQRPRSLARLFESLAAQDLRTPAFEVVVIDNDPAGTARSVVASARENGFAVSYTVEPVRNISRARNRGLDMSRAPLVAFIDDDETAAEDWLLTLHAALVAYEADGVFGSVEPDFAKTPSDWLRSGGFFLDKGIASGTPLLWYQTRTSNALLRREAFAGAAAHFDEVFGLTGGGDCAIFNAMLQAGQKLVAAPESVVYETIPSHRMRLTWLLARSLRNGSINWRITEPSASLRRSMIAVCHDVAMVLAHALKALRELFVDRGRAARGLYKAAFCAGRIGAVVGYYPRPYAARPDPVGHDDAAAVSSKR